MGPGLRKIGAVQKPSRLQCCGGAFLADVLFTSFLQKRPKVLSRLGEVSGPQHSISVNSSCNN